MYYENSVVSSSYLNLLASKYLIKKYNYTARLIFFCVLLRFCMILREIKS